MCIRDRSISKAIERFDHSVTHVTNGDASLEWGNKNTGKYCGKRDHSCNCIAVSMKDDYSRLAVLQEQMQNIYEEFAEESEKLKGNVQRNMQIVKPLPK